MFSTSADSDLKNIDFQDSNRPIVVLIPQDLDLLHDIALEVTAIHQELLKLLGSSQGKKQDLHKERFPLTPEGLFDQIWEAVLARDDLEQSLQDWRVMRLEAVAHEA